MTGLLKCMQTRAFIFLTAKGTFHSFSGMTFSIFGDDNDNSVFKVIKIKMKAIKQLSDTTNRSYCTDSVAPVSFRSVSAQRNRKPIL